jgi:hypothetical protein
MGENLIGRCLMQGSPVHKALAMKLITCFPKLINDVMISEEYYGIFMRLNTHCGGGRGRQWRRYMVPHGPWTPSKIRERNKFTVSQKSRIFREGLNIENFFEKIRKIEKKIGGF